MNRRHRTIVRYAGLVWLLAAGVVCLPLLYLLVAPVERHLWWCYVLPGLLMGAAGGWAWWSGRTEDHPLSVADGAQVVTLGWIGAILGGAISLTWSTDLSLRLAIFEATSGWTTTGLSVLDVTGAPRSALILRTCMEFAGGAGLVVALISLLGGPPGSGLAIAEGRSQHLEPHVRQSARLVLALCAFYTVLGTIGLRAAGMDLFDAFNHAACAVSTGGFSTRPDSIGAWDGLAVELVTLALMLVGTTNLVVAWAALRGRPGALLRSGETRLMIALVLGGAALIGALATLPTYGPTFKALRVAVFEVVSAISTTGYSTVAYTDWSPAALLVMTALMVIGGGAGSTAGGLKLSRVYLLLVAIAGEIRRGTLPRLAVNQPSVVDAGGRRTLGPEEVRSVAVYTSAYLLVFALGSWVMVAYGARVDFALFEMASTLSTVGLSVGVTSPTGPAAVLWLQVAAMLLGRLELFVVLVAGARAWQDGRSWVQARTRSTR